MICLIRKRIKFIFNFLIIFFILYSNNILFATSNNEDIFKISDKVNLKKATVSSIKPPKNRKKEIIENDEKENITDYTYKLYMDENEDFYFIRSDGHIVKNTWVVVNSKTIESNYKIKDASYHVLYFDMLGKAVKNKTKQIDGIKHSFDDIGFLKRPYKIDFRLNKKFIKSEFLETIKKSNIGDTIFFGEYNIEPDDKKENIMWDIIDKQGDKFLLLSSYIIETFDFDVNGSNDWEESSIRKWLNNTFLNEAFKTGEEISIISDSNILTNSAYTMDKIFLLSSEEAREYYKKYDDNIGQNEKLATMATNMARSRNIEVCEKENVWYQYNSPFFLRDKATTDGFVKVVGVYGHIYDDGERPKPKIGYGIRPAMWIDITNK